ncbi:MAG: PKD domain-containing protein, partial [Shewanella sp.]
VVALTVSDGKSARLSATATVLIRAEIKNAKPIAAINAEKVVGLNKAVTLDGATSSDADGDALTYSWKLVSKPTLSSASLRDAYSMIASVTPDEAGVYIAELVVNDGHEDSDPVRVSIEAIKVINPLPAGSGVMIKSTYFYGIDEGNGNVTLNSYNSACPSISAMDITPDGKLMGVYQWTTGLWQMDPYQPLCIKVGDVPRPSHIYSGMAIDAQGAIFVSDSEKLRQLDSDGSLLQEYAYSGHVSGVKGIDFASDGKLYGYTYHNNGELVEIDPRSGVTTLVAKMELPPEITIHDFYDIDIDSKDILRVSIGETNAIYRYNLNGKLLSLQSIAALPERGGFKAISYVK